MSIDNKINMWIDDNEHFLGEVLDEEKMKRWKHLGELCVEISDADEEIWHTIVPFSERSRNAMVCLDMPQTKFHTDGIVLKCMSKLFAEADAFVTSVNDGELRMTFAVHDMWTKFGYDNDMEHGDATPPKKPDLNVIK